ncbi:MAG: hypothetical protein JST92_25785 [Deltaproteobacteria bacterium]|nr:hypothetical protein [Deltaproteobacteria bacterium]
MPDVKPKRPRMQLEDLLLRHGAISDEQLRKAKEEQRMIGGDLGRHLVDLGYISEDLLLRALAHQLEIPLVDPEMMPISPQLLQAIPVQICERFGVIAVDGDPKTKRLRVATSDPGNRHHLLNVEQATGLRLEPAAATAASIEAAVRKYYYGETIQSEPKPPAIDFEAGERALANAEGGQAADVIPGTPTAGGQALQIGRLGTQKRLKTPMAAQRAQPALPPNPDDSAEPQEITEVEPIEEVEAVEEPAPPPPRQAPARNPAQVAKAQAQAQARAKAQAMAQENPTPGPEPLPEVSIEPELPPQVSWAEVQALAQRIERIEAFVTQPQFAAVLARVERLEQIATQLAAALRVVGGVLIDSQLITLEEYRKRTGLKG